MKENPVRLLFCDTYVICGAVFCEVRKISDEEFLFDILESLIYI